MSTDLIGRDTICDEIHVRMSPGRIVTLVGPGGVGKTRVAESMIAAYGGVFIDLAALRDADLLLAFIAERLGIPETSPNLFESLSRRLARDPRTIVLDNCEHLQEAVADIAQRLVDAAPAARLVATSRSPLGTRSEFVFLVGPLAPNDAHALFRARARSANAAYVDDPSAVARVCQRVDFLPLAIELAAARARVLPVDALATRLEGRMQLLGDTRAGGRQETLRTLVAWSDELLSDDLRDWFRTFGIFVGGWTHEAAAAIADQSRDDARAAARGLIERSLALDAGDGRTRLFEPMRDYAVERLSDDPGRAAIAERHARYFASLAMRTGSFSDIDDRSWIVAIEREMGNVRAALTWSTVRGVPGLALQFATSLGPFWNNHGRFSEGDRWLVRALESAPDEDARLQTRALLELRRLNTGRSNYAAAARFGERALATARDADDTALVSEALLGIAVNAFDRGTYDAAERSIAELYALPEPHVPPAALAGAWNLHGLLALMRGDHSAAAQAYANALERFRRIDDRMGVARVLSNLGNLDMYADRLDEAAALFEESLAITNAFNNVRLTCVLHANLAELGVRRNDAAFARKHASAEYLLARQTGRGIHIASALETLGETEMLDGRAEEAATIFSYAKRLRRELGIDIDPVNAAVYDSFVARSRAALGADAFSEAWRRGFELNADELRIEERFHA